MRARPATFILAWAPSLRRSELSHLSHLLFHTLPTSSVAATTQPPDPLLAACIPCRGGLMELFYGVYEKDPDRCLDALVTMGVLVPGGDRWGGKRAAKEKGLACCWLCLCPAATDWEGKKGS